MTGSFENKIVSNSEADPFHSRLINVNFYCTISEHLFSSIGI